MSVRPSRSVDDESVPGPILSVVGVRQHVGDAETGSISVESIPLVLKRDHLRDVLADAALGKGDVVVGYRERIGQRARSAYCAKPFTVTKRSAVRMRSGHSRRTSRPERRSERAGLLLAAAPRSFHEVAHAGHPITATALQGREHLGRL